MSSNRQEAFISPPLSESKQIIGEVQEFVSTGSRCLSDIATGITVSSLTTEDVVVDLDPEVWQFF